jgi:GDPmannose 4,6-dehydratase
MKKKVALITGITGQDGSYLAEFLIKKKYVVHGINRRTSLFNTSRIDSIFNKNKKYNNFFLHFGDMNDFGSINQIIRKVNPHEIYNLAAQSHVQVSFETPEYTSNTIALGTLRILEVIKNFNPKIKFYNASTSEMFGDTKTKPQNEKTLFFPNSPYAIAKLYAHLMTINYRESYGLFACNGILFNHESPRRGPTFVTKKIITALVKIKEKKQNLLLLGNIYSKRDWGHAKDYVEAQYKILQRKKPEDFVIATGKQYSIKDFINLVLLHLQMKGFWRGRGLNECFIYEGKKIIVINKKYFRPKEVPDLLGDFSKAKKILKWKPKIDIKQLISEMIDEEYKSLN